MPKTHDEPLTGKDYIDSRDMIERADYLRGRDEPLTEDEAEELATIDELAESGIGDWEHGVTLIREDKFEDYARDFAEDIHGKEVREASWPFDCIDWEKAANALRMDYTSVEFLGETYLVR